MNVQKLIRTALFSVFALLLAGSLATVHAQEEVTVNQDGNADEFTIQDGLSTLDTEVSNNSNTDAGVLIVTAGDHVNQTQDGNIAVGSSGATPNIGDLTIRVVRDQSSSTDRLSVESLDLTGGTDVTVESDGNGFLRIVDASPNGSNPNDLDLNDGTLTVDATDALRLEGGAKVFRTADGDVSSNAPTFQGDINLEFDTSGGDIEAGPETPTQMGGDVTVSGGNTVTFPENIEGSDLDLSSGSISAEGDASFATISSGIPSGSDLTVAGTLTISSGSLTGTESVDGSINGGDTTGDLALSDVNQSIEVDGGSIDFGTVTTSLDNTPGFPFTLIADANNAGTVNIGTLEVNPVADDDTSPNDYRAEIDAGFSGSDFTISTVSVGTATDGNDNTDETLVNVLNDNGGSVTVGGTLNYVNNNSSGGAESSMTLTGGTVTATNLPGGATTGIDNDGDGTITISGDVDYSFAGTVANSGGSQSGGTGEIEINSSATFTIDDTDNGGTSDNAISNGGAGVSGSGTLDLSGDSGDDFTIITSGVNVLPNVVANVETTINDDGGGSNLEIAGLTANAKVTLGNSSANSLANIGGELTANAEVDATAGDIDVQDGTIGESGTLNVDDPVRLTVKRDLTVAEQGVLALDANDDGTGGELLFDSSQDGVFETSTLRTLTGTVAVDKPNSSLRMPEALEVQGDFSIINPQSQFIETTFILEDNLIMNGSGTFTIGDDTDLDGGSRSGGSDIETRISEGQETFVLFRSQNQEIAGTDTLDNAAVQVSSSPAGQVDVSDAVEFAGKFQLRNGGLNVTGELNPVGDEAEVVRFMNGANTSIAGAFNASGNQYDLTYTRTGTQNTGSELTDSVRDLAVDAGAQPELVAQSATDMSYTVNGVLTVNGTISDDGSDAVTLALDSDTLSHTINGLVEGQNSQPVTIDIAGDGVTLNGGTGEGGDDAVVENVLVSGDEATIDGVQQIRGTLDIDGGSLELGLADIGNAGTGTDQGVSGEVTVSDSLSLASDVEVTSSSGINDVDVGSSGTINFNTYDLELSGDGADFDGDGDAQYFAAEEDGGALIFNDGTSGGSIQTFATAGEAVPNVTVEEEIDLDENVATDVLLDANAAINLGGNDFEFSGDVELDANVNAGTGIFRALGTTITTGAGNSIDNLEVDTDTTSLEIRTSDPTTPTARTLTIDDELILTSGTLDHSINDVVVNGNGTDDNVEFTSGEVVATSGVLDLDIDGTNPSANTITVTPTSSADDTLSVDNLTISGGTGSPAEFGDDGLDIEVRSDLVLDAQFDGTTGDGDLIVADGVTVERQSNYTARDVLTEDPAIEESYNLTYSGSTSDFNSGRELTNDGDALNDLEISSGADVYLESGSNAVVSGDVTVNGQLNLVSGDLDFGRQVVIADSAEVRRTPSGQFADVDGSGDVPTIDAPGFYTLIYDGNNSSSPTPFNAAEEEFLTDGDIALVTRTGSAGGPTDGDVDIALDRTVKTLTVENETDDSETFIGDEFTSGGSTVTSGNTLTVTDSVGVVGGDLTGGQVNIEGAFTIAGGEAAASFDVEGNTLISDGSLTGALTTAGDVVVEQTGSFGSATSSLTFDGTEQDLTLNGGPGTVNSLALSQQNGGDGRVYLTGDELVVAGSASNAVDFNSGLLVVPDSANGERVDPSEVLVELSSATAAGNFPGASIPFDRSDVDESDPNDMSHIVGRVRVGVPAGAPTFTPPAGGPAVTRGRFEFPVGTTEEYRPGAFTFRSDDPTEVSTDIVVQHVPTNPGGTEGFPINAGTDDQGDPVTIGENYPDQHWFVNATTGLGPSQELDAEFETGSGEFVSDFEDASELRLIRRFEGNAQQNRWRLQAGDAEDPGDEFDNTLIQRNGKEFARVQSRSSTGGITSNGALFTVGIPTESTAQLFEVAGSITYPTVSDGSLADGRSLSGVAVEVSSADTTVTDTTDADGNYRVTGLPAGDYDVTPTVSDSVDNVSTADALRTVRGFAGIDPFVAPFQEQVADVNDSGGVNATDALLIAQFVLGNVDGFDVGAFVTQSASVTLADGSATGVDLYAAEAGDVRLNGGESESSGAALASSTISPKSGVGAAATQSSSSSSSAGAEAGKTFEVPVQIDRNATVGAYQMTLDYPADKASFEGIKGTAQNVLTNTSDGSVKVSWFDQDGESALDLRDGSDLVTLQFKAADDVEGVEFAPKVTSGEIAGADATTLSAGVEVQAVRIGAPTPDEFALNGNYPNPVRSQATIDMDLPSRTDVTIEVYNVLGQRVQTMERTMSAGAGQTIQLDASKFASGQYFYRVKANLEDKTAQETGRITVVK